MSTVREFSYNASADQRSRPDPAIPPPGRRLAQAMGDALTVLVTYDKRMLDVAAAVGLPTAAPGLDD